MTYSETDRENSAINKNQSSAGETVDEEESLTTTQATTIEEISVMSAKDANSQESSTIEGVPANDSEKSTSNVENIAPLITEESIHNSDGSTPEKPEQEVLVEERLDLELGATDADCSTRNATPPTDSALSQYIRTS